MSDQSRARGNPSWRRGGPSPNPGGRPRSAMALSNAIREQVDPTELVRHALEILRDSDEDTKSRLAALNFLAERGFVKPPSLHAKRIEQINLTAMLPPNWEQLSPAARAAYLDQLPPRLLGDGEGEAL